MVIIESFRNLYKTLFLEPKSYDTIIIVGKGTLEITLDVNFTYPREPGKL